MMARNRYPSRQHVSMRTFSWKPLYFIGEILGGVGFLALTIVALNIIALF